MINDIPKYFISCDWGTSNFRLKVVDSDTLEVMAGHKTEQGIKSLYEQLLTQKIQHQQAFFSDYLLAQIQKLPSQHQGWPIVISGMASSNIGLMDLPYADFPLKNDGSSLIWKQIDLNSTTKALLISGVKSADGMMRGEEIQAVGLTDQLKPYGNGILLLPGTHSKHLAFKDNQFTSLKTFMTGELFELLSKKSLLANSVSIGPSTAHGEIAFREGLEMAENTGLSAGLFSVRARDVLKGIKKEDNFYYLSGLLIGDELSYLKSGTEKVFLVAPESIFYLYRYALETILDTERLVSFGFQIIEKALLKGQKKILLLNDK